MLYKAEAAAMACCTVAAAIPEIRITLLRLPGLAAMVTDERGTFKRLAKKRVQAVWESTTLTEDGSSDANAR